MTKKKINKKPAKKNSAKKIQAKNSLNNKPDISFIISDKSLTVNFKPTVDSNYETRTFDVGTNEYISIKHAIVDGKISDIPNLAMANEAKIRESIIKFNERFIKFENGSVKIDGKSVPVELSDRIITYATDGLPYMDLVNFFRNLSKNPSYRAVCGLFNFLDKNHFPFTSRGTFIAYKKVSDQFMDLWSKKFDNSVGKIVKMPRQEVNDNPAEGCSNGLHVASYKYALSYGGGNGILIEVEINPKDVVSVPLDDNFDKMRVCEYKVIGISKEEHKEQRVDDDLDDYHKYDDDPEYEYDDE